jgi:hypothetical protein
MSLLPRRGPGRHGRPDGVAVHPGWTLSPTSVTETPAYQPEHVRGTAANQPPSRWTSTPPVPALSSTDSDEPAAEVVAEPAAHVVAEVVAWPVAVQQPNPAAVATESGWASEWETIAATPATPATPGAPQALHTAAVAALDAVFGVSPTPTAWTAAPSDRAPQPEPALIPLDQPTLPTGLELATPLAVAAARAVSRHAAPAPVAVAPAPMPVVSAPVAPAPAGRVLPAAPSSAPPSSLPPSLPPPGQPPPANVVGSSAQQLLERAIRTALSAPAQRRSTVRLGFADASVIDLRPDDPIAKALHTVADALIGRDRA